MENANKEQKIRDFMLQQDINALLLSRVSSFAWATGGAASFVNTAADNGEASLLFTPEAKFLITNNIEAPRLEDEEKLKEQGWQFVVKDWWTDESPLSHLAEGLTLGADTAYPGAVDVSGELARERARLTSEETIRFEELGALCAAAMTAAVPYIKPGMTEYEIAAVLAKEMMDRGVYPIVQQVACDERTYAVRHAIPTSNKLKKYALIALCGRKYGLVASMSRAVYFGDAPQELKDRHEAAATVDATFIASTRPGGVISDIISQAQKAYAEAGYENEWKHHHQGGATGYEPREYIGTPTEKDTVEVHQAYAWNPSVAGTKSEDTIIIGGEENKVITETKTWPTVEIELDGKKYLRPGIMEIR